MLFTGRMNPNLPLVQATGADDGDKKTPPFPSKYQRKSSAVGDRCTWCIVSRKRCDGVNPTCGNCLRRPERCQWPVGRPSRTQVVKMLEEERLGPGTQKDMGDEGDSNNGAGVEQQAIHPEQEDEDIGLDQLPGPAQQAVGFLGPDQQQEANMLVLDRTPPPLQQSDRITTGTVGTQGTSVGHPLTACHSPGTERLEQVRERVLLSTRAYLERERGSAG